MSDMIPEQPTPIYDAVVRDPDLGGPAGWDPRSLWPQVLIDIPPATAGAVAQDYLNRLSPDAMEQGTPQFVEIDPDDYRITDPNHPTERTIVDVELPEPEAVTETQGVIVAGKIEQVETLTDSGTLTDVLDVAEVEAANDSPTVPEVPVKRVTDEELEQLVNAAISEGNPPNAHALFTKLQDDGFVVTYYRTSKAWKNVQDGNGAD